MVGFGFQPGTVSPSSRRADFDLRRRLAALEAGGGGGGGTGDDEVYVGTSNPGAANYELWYQSDTGVLHASVGGAWVDVSTGSGGGSIEEVFIGPSDPGGAYELWYDTDAVASSGAPATSYVHNQSAPAATWVVVHNLGFYPNVFVEDSAGTTVEGEVVFDNTSQLTLTFSAAFAGIAYLS